MILSTIFHCSSVIFNSRKCLGASTAVKLILVGIALIFIFIGGYNFISYGKSAVGGLSNTYLGGGCPSDNYEPLKCSCNGRTINTGSEKQFCCGGEVWNMPCQCSGINSCSDYKIINQGVDDQILACVENKCKPYFLGGGSSCAWELGECIDNR
ncbi:hypothetical protein HY483_00465 [Candidatus Woesearchaeota archaeon]|nr:hypothetical protein [Candidatus Woesearchaeota archaeon]